MSEIPEDIMAAAREAFRGGVGYPSDTPIADSALIIYIARAILAERDRHGWQPIETAPLDGTAVDLWAVRGELGESGIRPGDRYPDCRFARSHYGTEPFGEPVWQGLNDRYIKVTPTHWMPRPHAPKP